MSRPLAPEDLRLWSIVAATVRPAPGRSHPTPPSLRQTMKSVAAGTAPASPSAPPRSPPPTVQRRTKGALEEIEPGHRRRITREREPLAARIDLHGLSHDQARAALMRFLVRAQADNYRACLVITGKGKSGEGVLKRFVPEWLAAPEARGLIAGVSEAHRRHGGEGALYVALKRPA